MNREKIEEILSGVIDPYIKKDIISTKSVKNVSVKDNKVSIEIEFGYPLDGIKEKLSK